MNLQELARRKANNIRNFFEKDLWSQNLRELPALRSWLYHDLRVGHMLLRRFTQDRCTIRAASLTFSTLLSIVPLLAFILAIAQAFNLQARLEPFIMEHVLPKGMDAGARTWLSDFVQNAIDNYTRNTRVTALGGVGLLFLFYAVIRIMSTIENAFNDIWGIKKSRPLFRKVTDYLTLLILGPIAITVIMGLNIGASLASLGFRKESGALISWGESAFVALAPYLIYWLFLTVLYLFMPNTRVRFGPAACAGFFAGILLQLVQLFYVQIQVSLSSISAVYGAFAALPMFLIWLQLSWIVILLGAELSYALQNVSSYREEMSIDLSEAGREAIALQIMAAICRQFEASAPPATTAQLAEEFDIPQRDINELVFQLQAEGLIAFLEQPQRALMPGRTPRSIRVIDVLKAVRGQRQIEAAPAVAEVLDQLDAAAVNAGGSITVLDLLGEMKEKRPGSGNIQIT